MGRMEIITRSERRRKWSAAEKASLLAEMAASGESVAAFARRHGISESLLYNWRSQLKAQAVAAKPEPEPLSFMPIGVFGRAEDEGPALLAAPAPSEAAAPSAEARFATGRSMMADRPGVIEIELPNGVRIRVDAFVNDKALRRVFQAMKGLS